MSPGLPKMQGNDKHLLKININITCMKVQQQYLIF